MAALTDAMNWYKLGALRAARLKYFFKVEFYSSKYSNLPSKTIVDTVRTVELPKFSIETEVVNAWNVRQPIPTKINFEPVSISFTDTIDNRFQKFIKEYMNIVSGNFQKTDKSLRTGFDGFGLKSLAANADCPLDKIVITRFYGADQSREKLDNKSEVTLWRPKIVDVQHDTLDYASSDAITWQIGIRYESVTYVNEKEEGPGPRPESAPPTSSAKSASSSSSSVTPAASLNGLTFKEASVVENIRRVNGGTLPDGTPITIVRGNEVLQLNKNGGL